MKIKLSSEVVYVIAVFVLGLGVALVSSTDFGISMVAAPAYILSLKTGLSFGQCEYIVQGICFVLFCLIVRKIKWVYFSSFLTCLFYGFVLDFWRKVIPILNPSITVPGDYSFSLRIILFGGGVLLSTLSIAMFFRIYLYPAVLDFFVKGVCNEKKLDSTKFKIAFDFSCLFLSCLMSFVLFHKLVGIGIGTVIMTFINGLLIGFFGHVLDRYFEIKPIFIKFSKYFDI